MPSGDGWSVRYVSRPDFEAETGAHFATLEQAFAAIGEVLPATNSAAQRARARAELRERRRPPGE